MHHFGARARCARLLELELIVQGFWTRAHSARLLELERALCMSFGTRARCARLLEVERSICIDIFLNLKEYNHRMEHGGPRILFFSLLLSHFCDAKYVSTALVVILKQNKSQYFLFFGYSNR